MKRAKETKDNFLKIPKAELTNNIKISKLTPFSLETIKQLRDRRQEKISFSFKYFNRDKKEFNISGTCVNWFITLVDILKNISELNINELINQRQHYDVHGYKWDELKHKFDFSDAFLEQAECLQFRLSKSEGRVHGFVVGNIFYIVWLDPHHNLYPDARFGGTKYYERELTCYEKLMEYNLNLRNENKALMDIFEENAKAN